MDVYNAENEYVGSIDEDDGSIFDFNNQLRGRVEVRPKEGRSVVFSIYNTFVGSVFPYHSGQMRAFFSEGQFLADIHSDGTIHRNLGDYPHTQKDTVVGTVEPDGDPFIYGAAAFFFSDSAYFWDGDPPEIARII